MSNINESNKDHYNSTYNVGGEQYNGNSLTTKISRLKKKKEEGKLTSDEEKKLEELKSSNQEGIDKIYKQKKNIETTGGQGKYKGGNAHKKTHEKNGIPDLTNNETSGKTVRGRRSKVSNQIADNRLQYYESYEEEMENMKYLIEYMNNNDKPKII